MSENTNRRHQDFAKYDAMSTEELEEILRLDLDAPQEQESDTYVLLTIMEVLAQRKKEPKRKHSKPWNPSGATICRRKIQLHLF